MTDQQDLRARLLAAANEVQSMATRTDTSIRVRLAGYIATQLREAAAQLPAGVPDVGELASVRDVLVVAANNPVSHGGVRGLLTIMMKQAERIDAALRPDSQKSGEGEEVVFHLRNYGDVSKAELEQLAIAKTDSAAPGGDVEQMARELLAAEWEEVDPEYAEAIRNGVDADSNHLRAVIAALSAPGASIEQGYWIVQRAEGATIIHNAESGDSCIVEDQNSSPTAEVLRQLAQDASTWGRPTARIVGMRLIGEVPVQVAKPASEFLPEILLVTYDEYLKVAALSAPKQADAPIGYVRTDALRRMAEDDEITGVMVHADRPKDSIPVYATPQPAPRPVEPTCCENGPPDGICPECAETSAAYSAAMAPQPVEAEGREEQ